MRRVVGVAFVAVIVGGLVAPAYAAAPNKFFTPYNKIDGSAFKHVDAGTVGVSEVGDADYGSWPLYSHGKNYGHFNFKCERIVAHPKRDLCTAAMRIKKRGLVTFQTITKGSDAETLQIPVTGGTGDFKNASGTFTLEFARHGIHMKLNL